MLNLLLGGARSGKSALAVQLAQASAAPVTFIATAEARDEEMVARIAAHRSERPSSWTTIEEPVHLSRGLAAVPEGGTAVIDCLTFWVANLLEAGDDDAGILASARAVADRAASREGTTITVSNEVGSGIVPDNSLSRRYRDVLGRVNIAFSGYAADAFLVVAGRALPLPPAPSAHPTPPL